MARRFNLTDKRLEYATMFLMAGGTITSLAAKWGVDNDRLGEKLKQAGLDRDKLRRLGIEQLRMQTMLQIASLEGKDKFDSAMKYLTKYDNYTDEAERGETVDTDHIIAEILEEIR